MLRLAFRKSSRFQNKMSIRQVGIYRVNGSAVDMGRLKRAFESNPYEAEQLLKECDIHAVAGILKQYLRYTLSMESIGGTILILSFFRDLPECIFTSEAYPKLFEAYAIQDAEQRSRTYLHLFSQLPQNPSQACIVFLIEHLVRVAALDGQNKMSLHNLATVFGPTMLHAGPGRGNPAELLANSTRYPS